MQSRLVLTSHSYDAAQEGVGGLLVYKRFCCKGEDCPRCVRGEVEGEGEVRCD